MVECQKPQRAPLPLSVLLSPLGLRSQDLHTLTQQNKCWGVLKYCLKCIAFCFLCISTVYCAFESLQQRAATSRLEQTARQGTRPFLGGAHYQCVSPSCRLCITVRHEIEKLACCVDKTFLQMFIQLLTWGRIKS